MDQVMERPADHLPQLSLAERDRRWAAVRNAMAQNDVEALIVWGNDVFFNMGMANFRYLTHIGAQHGNCAAVFPMEGDPIVFHGPPHMHFPFSFLRVAQDWVPDVRPFRGARGVVEGVRELGLEQGSIGLVGFSNKLVGNTIPHQAVVELDELLPQARISDQSAIFEDLRLLKSDEEIAMLSRAGELARRSIVRLHETARPGVRECEVGAAMAYEQVANGADPQPFNMMAAGPIEGDPGVWHLNHGVEDQTTRPLREGDLIVCEFHASYGGYLAAAEFSVYLGGPPPELVRIAEVAVECLNTYRETMRAGNTLREVWEAARHPCRRAGLDFVELGFHGHGLASPEWPTVVYKSGPLGGEGLGEVRLATNMVFGLNIDIFDPHWKPNVGVMLGDMVRVTPTGGQFMVETPLNVFIGR